MSIDSIYILFCSLLLLWVPVIVSSAFSKKSSQLFIYIATCLGILSLVLYFVYLWSFLGRPPLRTLGETRLCYALLLSCLGVTVYYYYRLLWFLGYSLTMALLFLLINALHPEVFDKTLMPALQSPWFIPHVVVYIEGYALIAGATLIAAKVLFCRKKSSLFEDATSDLNMKITDLMVRLGYAFLTMGIVFGAAWAKESWGHYWTWDPKETWALLTWLCYVIYLHLRFHHVKNQRLAYVYLLFGFVVLLISWFGLNYLPASNQSIHTYGS